MRLLIATPVFDENIKLNYYQSILRTLPVLLKNGIEFDMINERRNLINMARNRSALYALNNGFDKLLFIDSDISWGGADVLALLNSKHRIVGGVYPLKAFPIKFNFVPPQNIYTTETFSIKEFVENHSDKETGEAEVHMLPTGFMMIDVSVFRDLLPLVESYKHRDQLSRNMEEEKMFFPFGIDDDRHILTEDWGFCKLVREKLHEKIYWNTNVIVDHVGAHTYSATVPVDKSYKHVNITEKQENDSGMQIQKTTNPFKKWPRNLQCFCGSGQKFKKCHEHQLKDVTHGEALILQPDFNRMLKDIQEKHDQGVGYKLKEPVL